MTQNLSEAFQTHGITPELLDSPPKEFLTIKYGSDVEVNLGNPLKPSQVQTQPITLSWPAQPDKFYFLLFVDPDAPSRSWHFLREVNHWMIGNIPGTDFDKGDLLSTYIGSGPPPGSGAHRYTFLVFEQRGKLTFDETIINGRTPRRMKFSTRDFIKKYDLGQPIAGNFFLAASESRCSIT
jgi:hypothetical protein